MATYIFVRTSCPCCIRGFYSILELSSSSWAYQRCRPCVLVPTFARLRHQQNRPHFLFVIIIRGPRPRLELFVLELNYIRCFSWVTVLALTHTQRTIIHDIVVTSRLVVAMLT